jgi:Na+/H+ antiporter NhaD/arsenite permease-like protein
MPQKDQGAVGSPVNTAVNNSISMSVGFAGIVAGHVNSEGDASSRALAARHMGVGFAGLGTIIASCSMFVIWKASRNKPRQTGLD